MIKRFVVTLKFLLFVSVSFSQSDTDKLFNYLNALKNYEYKSAKRLAGLMNSEISKEAMLLTSVLETAGQRKIVFSNKVKLNNRHAKIIRKLAFAYNSLYTNPYSSDSFQAFQEVYKYAKDTNIEVLEKYALISILEVYSFEMYQTNEDVLKYITAFENIKSDIADEYHYLMNVKRYNFNNVFYDLKIDESFFLEFDEVMKSFPESHKFWPNYLSSKAVFMETEGEFSLASALHSKAIDLISDEPFLKFIKFRSLIRLSEIARKENKNQKAINYIDSASNYTDKADSVRSKYYLSYYYSINYAKQNNFKKAYEYSKVADSLKVYLDYEKNTREITQLNIKYQTAEKEKQILEEQQKSRTTRNWLIAAGFALLFGTGIAILLQKNTTKKRQLAEQQTLLNQERVDNLLKEQELVSIDAMIEGQEKERQRVANELHDDLGSLMATIKLHFDNSKVSKKDPALQNAQKLLEEAYQKVRGMAHSKNSGVMSDQGLLPAIKKMAQVITETNALEVSVEDFGMGERLENSLELNLFRMVQELVANAIKHAEATKVNIQLTQHEDNMNIIIEDDGQGFDRSQLDQTKTGMGLTNIEKRVEYLEGSFTVDSVLGKGTSILIDIPV